jgi:molecular chaperone DnaK (HSP70)
MIEFGKAKFSVGIDLGTTHCAINYSELEIKKGEKAIIHTFLIPQVASPGQVEDLHLLPSFIYLPHHDEMSIDDISLPWQQDDFIITGEYAREKGTTTSNRIVSSAKSWLCQENIDKRSGILPQIPAEDIEAFSPLQATIYYLEHIRNAWNHAFPEYPLYQQEITLTIPASFDPSARELTAEAARLSDFEKLTLLEEPQAAFYHWIQKMGDDWKEYVKVGDVILVVDVGGGTTDFSLLLIEDNDGELGIRRLAVGDHILVGGDNMDLMLAHIINARFVQNGKSLEPWQIQALTHSTRLAKEKLLSNNSLEHISVVIPGRSSRLIGKTIKEKMTREDVQKAVIDGFFPHVPPNSIPMSRPRSGISRVGLNYAQDPAITRHLAAFLQKQKAALDKEKITQRVEANFVAPSAVLFNGGIFKSTIIRQKLLKTINHWLTEIGTNKIKELPEADYDLAVAKGAATFGHVRAGNAIRIKGGSVQSFYIGLESPMPAIPGFEAPIEALCIAPFGMEEGTLLELPEQEFGLMIGEPLTFRFFSSTVRREDSLGTVLPTWREEELIELQQIELTLNSKSKNPGEIVTVYLSANNNEVGTLTLKAHAKDSDESWNIDFNLRDAQRELALFA